MPRVIIEENRLRRSADVWVLREAFQHSDHVIAALADTRTVRDRLLTLVEKGWADGAPL